VAHLARKSLENTIRAELFGIERLEQHAESLAAAQRVMRHSVRGRRLLPRVERVVDIKTIIGLEPVAAGCRLGGCL
jgi:hypothetical protein